MTLELLGSVGLGLGLAAACGLRVFVPLLVMSLATRLGVVTPGESFAWLGSWPALVALSTACGMELAGYYLPWVDHLLDTVATPMATIAGAIVAGAAMVGVGAADGLPPILQWAAPLLAGGGMATTVQLGTVAMRGVSTMTTGGVGNPVVATVENASSLVLSVLAVVVPVLAAVIVFATVIVVGRFAVRRVRGRCRRAAALTPVAATSIPCAASAMV